MIPIQLRIKNFLSYGSELQTINFGPYPLICLSGKNGHGKSALLDAITWALWGQARKISGIAKPDQGLLHLGQTHMMVVFDFLCNNTHYRVKREFAQTYGKPYANLEFGTIQTPGEAWIPLSGKTIRATQETLEHTIRLSFESFINSAFLRQGQSHEFSTKSPKERKEILATVLGLQEYEAVRKQAMEYVKELTTQKTTLNFYQEKLAIELQKKTSIDTQHIELAKELEAIQNTERHHRERLDAVVAARANIHEHQKQLEIITFKFEQLIVQEQQFRTQLLVTRSLWREVNRHHHHQEDIALLESRKKELNEQLGHHQRALQESLVLKEELLQHKHLVHSIERQFQETYQQKIQERRIATERLGIKVEHLSQQISDTEKHASTKQKEITLCVTTLEKALQEAQNKPLDDTALSLNEQQFEKRKNFYQLYRSQGMWVTNELEVLQQKKKLSHDDQNPSCPLCEQNLSISRKKFLQQKFSAQEHFLNHRLQQFSRLVTRLKELLVTQHEYIKNAQKQRAEHQQNHTFIDEHNKKHATLLLEQAAFTATISALHQEKTVLLNNHAQAKQELDTVLHNYPEALRTYEPYRQASTVLLDAERKLSVNSYQQQVHQHIQQELETLNDNIARTIRMQQQYATQHARKQEIIELCTRLKTLKHELNCLQATLTTFSELGDQLEQLEKQHDSILHEMKNTQQHREQLLLQKGSLELEYKRLATVTQELEKNKEQIEQYCTLIQDYQAIAQATSKDGVQALLIEQALPEIEFEANELLSKLTNNQAHIMIESLRDLKKGGTKETLDIKISDSAGIRPYEMFSGGEAFRIDFALRIAISKLLARRSGTSLQTLIIDEGFGSQDEEGLSHIMDAIYKIQDDFAKVIIVSHLSSMKDNFPVHFVVEKKPQGSMVRIVEQE